MFNRKQPNYSGCTAHATNPPTDRRDPLSLPRTLFSLSILMLSGSANRLPKMWSVVISLLLTLRTAVQNRVALHLEILALRHQLQVVNRSRPQRVRLTGADRVLWVWLSRVWNDWRAAVLIVRPETVLAWHRRGFRLFWTWRSRRRVGRPGVPADVRQLIRTIAEANAL